MAPHIKQILDIPFQRTSVDQVEAKMDSNALLGSSRTILLRATTGAGKMFMACEFMKRQLAKGLKPPEGSFNPLLFLVICPGNLIHQWTRTLQLYKLAHLTRVTSYAEMRSSLGELYIDWELQPKSYEGEDDNYTPRWKDITLPACVVVDEVQYLRNPVSQQTSIIRAMPKDKGIIILGTSATAFQKVADARWFVEATRCITPYNALPATETTASHILNSIAYPGSPDKLNQASMRRLKEALANYIVDVKGVRFKHKIINNTCIVDFISEESRLRYEQFFNEWLEELAKLNRRAPSSQWGLRMAALTKFQQGAEIERKEIIGEAVLNAINQGKQVLVASKYLQSLRAWWVEIVKQRNYPAELVSFVVGGQTPTDRQAHIDKFMEASTRVLMYTIRSGGVGLNLNHDRPTSFPRKCILPPTYNAIDYVQAVGRGLRLDNLSDVEVDTYWFKDTVEVKVASTLKTKIRCLSAAVENREQWSYILENKTEEMASEDEKFDSEELDETDSQLTGEGMDVVVD